PPPRSPLSPYTTLFRSPIDKPRRLDAIATQRRQERHRFPMAVRHLGFDPLSDRCPASQRRHVGLCPGLVDEDKARWIDQIAVLRSEEHTSELQSRENLV